MTSSGLWPEHERNESEPGSGTRLFLMTRSAGSLLAMTTDFREVWDRQSTPNRERKRLLAYIIEDVTLIKIPAERTTKIHVRFKGGKTETLTTLNPRTSAQQIQTQKEIVELVDQLLDHHVYSEIADILNERGLRPGGSARLGREADRFTPKRVAYLMHTYNLRSRYDRLRARGMLNRQEMADRRTTSISTNKPLRGGRNAELSTRTFITTTDGNSTKSPQRTRP